MSTGVAGGGVVTYHQPSFGVATYTKTLLYTCPIKTVTEIFLEAIGSTVFNDFQLIEIGYAFPVIGGTTYVNLLNGAPGFTAGSGTVPLSNAMFFVVNGGGGGNSARASGVSSYLAASGTTMGGTSYVAGTSVVPGNRFLLYPGESAYISLNVIIGTTGVYFSTIEYTA